MDAALSFMARDVAAAPAAVATEAITKTIAQATPAVLPSSVALIDKVKVGFEILRLMKQQNDDTMNSMREFMEIAKQYRMVMPASPEAK